MTFGNFLGNLMNLVPGYYQGKQQAIKDNWQDLSNYNQVQKGQLGNLFEMATFYPKVQMVNDQEQLSGYNVQAGQRNNAAGWMQFPTIMTNLATQAMYAPELAQNAVFNTLNKQYGSQMLFPYALGSTLQGLQNGGGILGGGLGSLSGLLGAGNPNIGGLGYGF